METHLSTIQRRLTLWLYPVHFNTNIHFKHFQLTVSSQRRLGGIIVSTVYCDENTIATRGNSHFCTIIASIGCIFQIESCKKNNLNLQQLHYQQPISHRNYHNSVNADCWQNFDNWTKQVRLPTTSCNVITVFLFFDNEKQIPIYGS